LTQKGKKCYFYADSKEFFEAVKMNDIIGVLRLLKTNPSLVNDRDRLQRSPLHWACKRNFYAIV